MNRVFILINASKDLSKGRILYRGEPDEEHNNQSEYFDMTTEIETGHSYSYFDIHEGDLINAPEAMVKKIEIFLKTGKLKPLSLSIQY